MGHVNDVNYAVSSPAPPPQDLAADYATEGRSFAGWTI